MTRISVDHYQAAINLGFLAVVVSLCVVLAFLGLRAERPRKKENKNAR